MNVFWCLIFSHVLADFTFQTNFIAEWKDRNIWGRWAHVIIFLSITFLMTFPVLNDTWISFGSVYFQGWLCVVILTLLHLLEDQFRIWCVHHKRIPDCTLFFIFDQTVHIGLILLFTPGIMNTQLLNITWMQIGTIVVLNTHFTTVLVYYLEKDLYRQDAHRIFAAKYLPITERLLMAGCFLIPGWWWVFGIIAWILIRVLRKIKQGNHRTWIDFGVSFVSAIVTGFCARIVLFPF